MYMPVCNCLHNVVFQDNFFDDVKSPSQPACNLQITCFLFSICVFKNLHASIASGGNGGDNFEHLAFAHQLETKHLKALIRKTKAHQPSLVSPFREDKGASTSQGYISAGLEIETKTRVTFE